MKSIISSIIFNLIGMVLLIGSIGKNILGDSVNSLIPILGIILILFGLVALFFYKDNLKQINGIRVSSRSTIIHKFFFSLITFVIIQNILYAAFLMLIKSAHFDWSIFLSIIVFVLSFFIPIRMASFKAVKFNKEYLFISNYFRYEKVKLSDVISIKCYNFLKIYRIKYNSGGKSKVCHFLGKIIVFGFLMDVNLQDLISIINEQSYKH